MNGPVGVTEERPWPVVLLTALGAWLAAIPLLFMVFTLLGDMLVRDAGPYITGLLVLGMAVVVLRSSSLPLFVEQLAIPGLLVGGGTLAFGLFRDLSTPPAAAVLAMLALAVAWSVPRNWLRVLLGAAACMMAMIACLPANNDIFSGNIRLNFWLAWHAVFGIWLLASWLAARRLNEGVDAILSGWMLLTLAGMAFWSGMTFLVGSNIDGGVASMLGGIHGSGSGMALQAVSLALAACAAAWIGYRWPGLRQLWSGMAALIVVGLAWPMPSLGAVLLILSMCLAHNRWRLSIAAALAAAWIIGSFYYQLRYPLATKAIMMTVAGAVLGALAWLAMRGNARQPAIVTRTAAPDSRVRRAGIMLAALAILAVANIAIWQKEDLIAHGQPVYVELAPVDPRSLIQGDYMQLNFRIPAAEGDTPQKLSGGERAHVVVRRDARGVATLLRMHAKTPLVPGEFLIELTPKAGRWIVVSDAWFFKEGDANRWAKAKYGEFRVNSDGRALLVGLRGPDLEQL